MHRKITSEKKAYEPAIHRNYSTDIGSSKDYRLDSCERKDTIGYKEYNIRLL